MTQDRGTEALLSSIDWLRRSVLEMGERNRLLEAECTEERIRSQQLARDCQSDLNQARGAVEKAEARTARLERELVEKCQEALKLKAELEATRQKLSELGTRANEAIQEERRRLAASLKVQQDLENRYRELSGRHLEAQEALLDRDRKLHGLELDGLMAREEGVPRA
jgi:hypothetical protein